MTTTAFWLSVLLYLGLLTTGLVVGVVLAILWLFRDRTVHHTVPMTESVQKKACSALNRLLVKLANMAAGTEPEIISKQKVKSLINR